MKTALKTIIIGLIGGLIAWLSEMAYNNMVNKDITGEWTACAITEKTTYSPFKNAKAIFAIHLSQSADGNIIGIGEKTEEIDADGKIIKYETVQRDRINITGIIKQHVFSASEIFLGISETGSKYKTTADFNLKLIKNDSLAGIFSTTIADGSGQVTMLRKESIN